MDPIPVTVQNAKPAAHKRSTVGPIIVYHSAYERPLLRLVVYERDDDIARGLPFKLVRDPCFIIANNKDGRFEKWHLDEAEVVSYTPVVLGRGGLLGPGKYTYHVDGPSRVSVLFRKKVSEISILDTTKFVLLSGHGSLPRCRLPIGSKWMVWAPQ